MERPAVPPQDRRRRAPRPRHAVLLVLLPVVVVALVVALPGDDQPGRDEAADCSAVRAERVRPDRKITETFARYGDDGSRTDDWTGGDGTRSVRLPDGRTLWLFADTFLDRVHPGGRRVPQPVWVRNSVVVTSPAGRPRSTLTGDLPAADGRPTALFPGTATPDGREVWRWPADAVVEPRRPGSGERVVRVLLWQREAAGAPWLFGVPRATEVATLSLPGLRLENLREVHRPPPSSPPGDRVLWGTSAVRDGGWTYVFGADERGTEGGGPSRTYVARAPRGSLDDPAAWRYRTGAGWSPDGTAARPMDVATRRPDTAEGGAARGAGSAVTNTYTVTRHGGTWLLISMDAGGPDGRPSQTVVSYWSCTPHGPWHGPDAVTVPGLPPGGRQAGATAYNVQAHGDHDGRGLLLSYDVNVLGDPSAVQADVARYRPRFLRVGLAPEDGGRPDRPG